MKSSLRSATIPWLCALAVLCIASRPVAAVTPREELLRLVPADAGFCLVLGDLRGHAARILESPWFKALRQSRLGATLANSPEGKKLSRFLNQDLQKRLQVAWPRLRDDVLGDALVFAYRPGPPGNPQEEKGLFLLWARDADLLATLVARLNQEQMRAGEVKAVEERVHKGRKYYQRVEQKGDSYDYYYLYGPVHMLTAPVPVPVTTRQYYFLDGSLLAFSTRQDMLLPVIDGRIAPPAKDKTSRVATQLARAGADRALAALWLNPRALDADIRQHAARSPPAEAQGLHTFFRYWQALEAVVLSVDLGRDLDLSLSVQARPEALPAAARRLLAEAPRPSELWGRFPAPSILAVAGRIDATALNDFLADFLTVEARDLIGNGLQRSLGAAMGMNLVHDVLPQLGPDWGFCVAAAPDRASFPHVLAALRIQPGDKDTAVDQAFLKAVQFIAGLAVFDYNRKHADQVRVKTVAQGAVEVKYLANDKGFPTGLQPAVALKDGYLVLASSPNAIRRFGAAAAAPVAGREIPLLRLSLVELGSFMKTRREALSAFLAAKNQLSSETAGKVVETVLASLDLFEQLEVTQRTDAGQVVLNVRLRSNPRDKNH
jgi:hypothetical protein